MYSILLTPAVIEQLKDIINYLDQQQSGLGLKFYQYFLSKINILKSNPVLTIVYDEIMCIFLKKYKYRVHYTIDHQKSPVKILAIFHTSRDPENWK